MNILFKTSFVILHCSYRIISKLKNKYSVNTYQTGISNFNMNRKIDFVKQVKIRKYIYRNLNRPFSKHNEIKFSKFTLRV